MIPFETFRPLIKKNDTKIVMIVLDGAGGIQMGPSRSTSLQRAEKKNIDLMASEGALGLFHPVSPGITPGCGLAQLALLGYDPLQVHTGSGVLDALGAGIDIEPGDIGISGELICLDKKGEVTDVELDDISEERCSEVISLLRDSITQAGGAKLEIKHISSNRFALTLRGKDLNHFVYSVEDEVNKFEVLKLAKDDAAAENTIKCLNDFVKKAAKQLEGREPFNGVILSGFSSMMEIEPFEHRYMLRSAALASQDRYKGFAQLLGMKTICTGVKLNDQISAIEDNWDEFDFFYFHVSEILHASQEGSQDSKIKIIEEIDSLIPRIVNLQPDVVVITSDHSSPASFEGNSWHPCPTMVWSPGRLLIDRAVRFDEVECTIGALGHRPSGEIMPLALACAMRLHQLGS